LARRLLLSVGHRGQLIPLSPSLNSNDCHRIGFGAAQAFIDAGAIVTVISSSQSNVDSAVSRLASPNASGLVGDVRDESAFIAVLQSLAPVDHIIFSSVDIIIRGKLEDLDLDSAKHLFGVKFWGAVIVGKAVKKYNLIKPGGSLTLTSGTAALKPGKGASTGGALNGGVISLTKGLAGDLAEHKIRVNVVVPGLVKTELWDKLGKTKEEKKEQFENTKLPVGFVATPDDIAEAYLYLVKADYATGTSVEIGKHRVGNQETEADHIRWWITSVLARNFLYVGKVDCCAHKDRKLN
jgi:NAD(P)-dependent dehydrogenase (short-subunit alcohol dehydrogenase family)